MWRCLEADLEILVHQGILYLPLLRDPDIHREIQARLTQDSSTMAWPALMAVHDRLYVRAVTVSSLIDHYSRIYPQEHENHRRLLLEQYSLSADLWGINLDPKLITIVFHILPHFMRRDGLPQRQRIGEGNILDLIRERVRVPSKFYKEARRFLDVRPLREALNHLESAPMEVKPPPEGLMPAAGLKAWWEEAQAVRILAEIRTRLLEELEDREQWVAAQEERLTVLLYLADTGSLELDGFGFTRTKQGRDYRIYKRTGPYALKDFYGRLYLFPDCRVAVTTFGRLRPVVVDHYKHPFLRQHGPGQPICVGTETQNLTFSAKHVIQALEEGINALLYSYDSRQRRGYHKLDNLPGSRGLVHFEDYRIPQDHPLIVSGQVEVKNRIA